MKDHEIAKLVNDLRDIAVEFGQTQQLRERIHRRLVPEINKLRTIESDLLNSIAMRQEHEDTAPHPVCACQLCTVLRNNADLLKQVAAQDFLYKRMLDDLRQRWFNTFGYDPMEKQNRI